jgi:cyclophilin family peptidyl-prolyl cis-trans isomerase
LFEVTYDFKMRKRDLVVVVALLMGCASSSPPATEPAPRVTMITTAGTFTATLLPQAAPQTVAQFLRLVQAGVYDSVYFFRLDQGFVLQTATADDREVPLTDAQKATIRQIPLEPASIRHTRGVLSLAHFDDPNSGETSFSILLADAPHLDGKFTVFGMLEGDGAALRAIEENYDRRARDKSGKRLQIISIKVSAPSS